MTFSSAARVVPITTDNIDHEGSADVIPSSSNGHDATGSTTLVPGKSTNVAGRSIGLGSVTTSIPEAKSTNFRDFGFGLGTRSAGLRTDASSGGQKKGLVCPKEKLGTIASVPVEHADGGEEPALDVHARPQEADSKKRMSLANVLSEDSLLRVHNKDSFLNFVCHSVVMLYSELMKVLIVIVAGKFLPFPGVLDEIKERDQQYEAAKPFVFTWQADHVFWHYLFFAFSIAHTFCVFPAWFSTEKLFEAFQHFMLRYMLPFLIYVFLLPTFLPPHTNNIVPIWALTTAFASMTPLFLETALRIRGYEHWRNPFRALTREIKTRPRESIIRVVKDTVKMTLGTVTIVSLALLVFFDILILATGMNGELEFLRTIRPLVFFGVKKTLYGLTVQLWSNQHNELPHIRYFVPWALNTVLATVTVCGGASCATFEDYAKYAAADMAAFIIRLTVFMKDVTVIRGTTWRIEMSEVFPTLESGGILTLSEEEHRIRSEREEPNNGRMSKKASLRWAKSGAFDSESTLGEQARIAARGFLLLGRQNPVGGQDPVELHGYEILVESYCQSWAYVGILLLYAISRLSFSSQVVFARFFFAHEFSIFSILLLLLQDLGQDGFGYVFVSRIARSDYRHLFRVDCRTATGRMVILARCATLFCSHQLASLAWMLLLWQSGPFSNDAG